jgi:large subunit ribosomal protein L22
MKKSKVYAKLSDSLTSAKKVRIVMDLIRNKNAVEALNILMFTKNKGAKILYKLLKSAVGNAQSNMNLSENNLYVSEVYANEAPMLKRFRPGSRSNVYPILKRRSHLVIGLSERMSNGTES